MEQAAARGRVRIGTSKSHPRQRDHGECEGSRAPMGRRPNRDERCRGNAWYDHAAESHEETGGEDERGGEDQRQKTP